MFSPSVSTRSLLTSHVCGSQNLSARPTYQTRLVVKNYQKRKKENTRCGVPRESFALKEKYLNIGKHLFIYTDTSRTRTFSQNLFLLRKP